MNLKSPDELASSVIIEVGSSIGNNKKHILAAVTIIAWLSADGFASLWRGYAAICAGAITLYMRSGNLKDLVV